jgi:acyl carrier protein
MTREDEILGVLRQFVADLGEDPGNIRPDAQFADLGIDSYHIIELLFRLEDRYEIELPLDKFPTTTIGTAVQFVADLLRTPISTT